MVTKTGEARIREPIEAHPLAFVEQAPATLPAIKAYGKGLFPSLELQT